MHQKYHMQTEMSEKKILNCFIPNIKILEGAIDKRLSIAISRTNRYWQTFVNSDFT